MNIRRVVIRVIKYGAGLAVFVLCGLALADNLDRLSAYSISWSWLFALGSALFVAGVVIGGVNWHRLIALITDIRLPVVATVRGHSESWLHRYIPGVGYLGHKILWARNHGVTRGAATTAFLYEQILIQASSFGFGIVTVGFALLSAGNITPYLWLVIAVTVAGIIVFIFSGSTVEKFVNLIRRKRGIDGDAVHRFLSPAHTTALFGQFVLPRIVNALAVVVIAIAIVPVSVDQALTLGGSYAIASAIGILAVFVPSGLGVRESVFVGFATLGGVSLVDAIMLSIVVRVISTVSDAAIGVGVLATAKRRPPQ
jgi:uncharacterized membrane protein YbhN (UPF0104 family)